MRLNRCGYLIREGFRSIGTHGFMSFASVTIIMACLIIMGSVSLLSVNIDALIKDLENENEVVAFVDENIEDEEQAKAIGTAIEELPNVMDAEFVSRDTAMDNFMSNYDDDMMVGIDATVFKHRFVIHLNDISLMAQTQNELKNIDGIVKVRAHLDYAKAFVTIRNIVSVVSLILIVILVFVSVFIMSNTIKLATFGRREEIAIMKMVGATNSFIRLPFVVEGLILGFISSLVAFFLEWGLYDFLASKIAQIDTLQLITIVPFAECIEFVAIAYAVTGFVVGVFGSMLSIRKFLRV